MVGEKGGTVKLTIYLEDGAIIGNHPAILGSGLTGFKA
jgi:hypothetical protein